MELQTQIPIYKAKNQLDYASRTVLLGSCFVEHIGGKLAYFNFRNVLNPMGILFHPKAIENLIVRSIARKWYTDKEVFLYRERWHSHDAHSRLSDVSQEGLLQNLNKALKLTYENLQSATHLVLTLGTAWGYRLQKNNAWVANCHKLPQREFTKELLSVDEITKSLGKVVRKIRNVNPKVQFIFTVSPVRHLKDGFVDNQRSKAHLVAAIHHLIGAPGEGVQDISYFPAYELMMDELRDYRFYENDMVHPNTLAIDYIWEKFKRAWISETAYPVMEKVHEVQQGLRHRPFNPDSSEHQIFKKSLHQKISYLEKKYPFMDF